MINIGDKKMELKEDKGGVIDSEAAAKIKSIINSIYYLDKTRWLISLIENKIIILEKVDGEGKRIIARIKRGSCQNYSEAMQEGNLDIWEESSAGELLTKVLESESITLENPLTARIRSWRITREQYTNPPGISDKSYSSEEEWAEKLLLHCGLSLGWEETFGEAVDSKALLRYSIIHDEIEGVKRALVRNIGVINSIHRPETLSFFSGYNTSLMLALRKERQSIVELLISKGANLSKTINYLKMAVPVPKVQTKWLIRLGLIYLDMKYLDEALICFNRVVDIGSASDIGVIRLKLVEYLVDIHWYTDNEINALLRHYLGQEGDQNIELLTAMLATNLERGNDLQENLSQFQNQRTVALRGGGIVKNRVLIPINLCQNHWALLYLIYREDTQLSEIFYFDPLGDPFPEEVSTVLSTVFPGREVVNVDKRVQEDGYNCGPWVIEAARAIIGKRAVFEPGVQCDIEEARRAHARILGRTDITSKSTENLVNFRGVFGWLIKAGEKCYGTMKIFDYSDKKYMEEARECYDAATKIDSENLVAWYRFGEILFSGRENEGYLKEAQVAFHKVIAIDPKCLDALYGLSEVYFALSEFADGGLKKEFESKGIGYSNELIRIKKEEGGALLKPG
jgi:tetratricopeptide (TPR) repeat protein